MENEYLSQREWWKITILSIAATIILSASWTTYFAQHGSVFYLGWGLLGNGIFVWVLIEAFCGSALHQMRRTRDFWAVILLPVAGLLAVLSFANLFEFFLVSLGGEWEAAMLALLTPLGMYCLAILVRIALHWD